MSTREALTGLNVSRETEAQLHDFVALVKKWKSGHKFDRAEQCSQHLEPPYRRFGPNRRIGQRLGPLDRHWERRGAFLALSPRFA